MNLFAIDVNFGIIEIKYIMDYKVVDVLVKTGYMENRCKVVFSMPIRL